jgi:arylsulfatase A-like enzyme
LQPRPELPGKSFAPLTFGETRQFEGPVFSECGSWKMIRLGDSKLVTDGEDFTPIELFHLQEDPYEMDNLVERDSCSSERESLRARIVEWQEYVAAHRC